jgi:ATP-binding cassette subfamily F protein 3
VADRLWLVGDGTVRAYDGDLDDYRGLLAERARGPRADPTPRRAERRERADARAALAPLRKQAKAAEARVTTLLAERAALEAKLADPASYSEGRKTELAAMRVKLTTIIRLVKQAEEAWIAAEEALEVASN